MDVFILASHSDDPSYHSFLQVLSESAFVFHDDLDSFADACTSSEPRLLVLISYEETLPSNWDIKQWKAEHPLIVFLDVKNKYLPTFETLCKLLKTFTDLDWYPQDSSNEHPLFRNSLAYMEENLFDSDLTLEKVSSQAYLSRCHYSRIFRNYFGTGFKEYIIDKRVQKAKLLLREGHSVTEVCFAVGYNDLTHFSRIFKKWVGITPSSFRKNWINKAKSPTTNAKNKEFQYFTI